MTSSEALILARLILHVLTVALLASYCSPKEKFRLGPSIMAGLLLSSSASLAVQIVLNWEAMVLQEQQPQFVLFVFTVFLPIAWAKGNVAKIYDGLSRCSSHGWWHRR